MDPGDAHPAQLVVEVLALGVDADIVGGVPGEAAIDAFAHRFGKLTHTKSTLHLPYSEPMPWELLREMVEFCVAERLK